jgi:hypothetical protein
LQALAPHCCQHWHHIVASVGYTPAQAFAPYKNKRLLHIVQALAPHVSELNFKLVMAEWTDDDIDDPPAFEE